MNFDSELLLIDKPKGITSFDVIRRLRRLYSDTHGGQKAPKLGHAGTLDPLATGLMIIGVGSGTKRLAELIKLDKTYEAEILIGERRSTGDMEGEVLEECRITEDVEVLAKRIHKAVKSLEGTLSLPVSAYSAIKVDGVPMYKRARKAELSGDTVLNVPVRLMRVDSAVLTHVAATEDRVVASVRFDVGSGVYIRSLAEELGNRIGYPATLYNLRRIRVGSFNVRDAVPIK